VTCAWSRTDAALYNMNLVKTNSLISNDYRPLSWILFPCRNDGGCVRPAPAHPPPPSCRRPQRRLYARLFYTVSTLPRILHVSGQFRDSKFREFILIFKKHGCYVSQESSKINGRFLVRFCINKGLFVSYFMREGKVTGIYWNVHNCFKVKIFQKVH